MTIRDNNDWNSSNIVLEHWDRKTAERGQIVQEAPVLHLYDSRHQVYKNPNKTHLTSPVNAPNGEGTCVCCSLESTRSRRSNIRLITTIIVWLVPSHWSNFISALSIIIIRSKTLRRLRYQSWGCVIGRQRPDGSVSSGSPVPFAVLSICSHGSVMI